jgi:uncharacterized glyoxalase superfamily protein PhnB
VNGLEAGIVGRERDVLLPFYVDILGFEIIDRLEFPDGFLVKLRRDGARVKIFFPTASPSPPPAVDPYWAVAGWRYAALLFDDHDAMHTVVARVDASNGRVVMAPQQHRPGAEAGLVADPEGNVWELLWEA